MAKIAFINDVVVPGLVAAANIGVHAWDDNRLAVDPSAIIFEPIVGIVGLGAGYAMQAFDLKPTIGNRIAVASFVPGARGIYDWVKGAIAGGTTSRGTIKARRRIRSRVAHNPGNPGSELEDPLLRYRESGL